MTRAVDGAAAVIRHLPAGLRPGGAGPAIRVPAIERKPQRKMTRPVTPRHNPPESGRYRSLENRSLPIAYGSTRRRARIRYRTGRNSRAGRLSLRPARSSVSAATASVQRTPGMPTPPGGRETDKRRGGQAAVHLAAHREHPPPARVRQAGRAEPGGAGRRGTSFDRVMSWPVAAGIIGSHEREEEYR
jgi:hypothetical protein